MAVEAIDRGAHLWGLGPVADLERRLESEYGVPYALAVASGTAGLFTIALALGLKDAEIIGPAYTYGATFAPFLSLGNALRFCEVDPRTLTLDPDDVARAITRRTRAIVSVDLFGTPADDDALRAVADAHGLWLIADAAQSLGARRRGRPASTRAHALVTSFTCGKPLDVGEGGAILSSSAEIYARCLWLSQHPHRQRLELGISNETALNARCHPLAAALAARRFDAGLARLTERRRRTGIILEMANQIGLTEPPALDGLEPTFFRLVLSWSGRAAPARLRRQLGERGLKVAVTAPPIGGVVYQQPGFVATYEPAQRASRRCSATEAMIRRLTAIEDLALEDAK